MKINKGSTLTPSEYFGLDPNSKYSELFNHIYKLTQVRQFETEIEEGEIDEEVPVESEFQDTQEEHLAYQSTAEDLSCRKIQTQSNEKQPEERQFIPSSLSWLNQYLDFMCQRGEPVSVCPSVMKEPLDLYRLYRAVGEEGGFRNCSAKKAWKKVSVKLTENHRKAYLWRHLQKQYRKYLLKYEIFDKYDGNTANLEELCQLDTQ